MSRAKMKLLIDAPPQTQRFFTIQCAFYANFGAFFCVTRVRNAFTHDKKEPLFEAKQLFLHAVSDSQYRPYYTDRLVTDFCFSMYNIIFYIEASD